MKKLLIIYAKNHAELFNRKSALGSYIYTLSEVLSRSGFEVYLNGESFEKISEESDQHQTLQGNSSGIKKIVSRTLPAYFRNYLRDKKTLFQVLEMKDRIISRKQTFSAVLEFYSFGSDIGFTIARSQKIPLTLVYDAPLLEEYAFFNGSSSPLKKSVLREEKKSIEAASNIVVYSNPMKIYLQKIYPDSKSSFFIHQNVDFSRFKFKSDDTLRDDKRLNICFVGSFLKWHRVDILIKSYHQLKQSHPELNLHLFLIGDGMEKAKSEELAKQTGLTDYTFTGFLDGQKLSQLQEKMDIGIMPGSNWYGAPNKLFEYGAMKMACIAPNTPTISDLFDESSVYFFENNNADSFYRALETVCLDKALRDQLRENLSKLISARYSINATANFYSKLLTNNRLNEN